MSSHILVPLDGSEPSMQALEHALTEHPDAEFTVLHVLDFVEGGYDAPIGANLPGYWEDWYERGLEAAEDLFEEAQTVADEHGVDLETEVEVGLPARTILDVADEREVDHVVIGSHGRSGVSRILLGSVAESVVRRAPVPVTVVR